jgi:hypothetical protein
MNSITTDFPTFSSTRSRAERFADGVVARYIHGLAGAAQQPALTEAIGSSDLVGPSSRSTASAQAVDAQPEVNPSSAQTDDGSPRRATCWKRGGRGVRPSRAQRVFEAR